MRKWVTLVHVSKGGLSFWQLACIKDRHNQIADGHRPHLSTMSQPFRAEAEQQPIIFIRKMKV